MSVPGSVSTPEEAERAVAELLEQLAPQQGRPASPAQRRTLLADLLTVRPPDPIPSNTAALLDALLDWENSHRPSIRPADLPRLRTVGVGARLSLWQGDITTLAADAIVNAANNRLLGCFVPGHTCIDNVIHAIAGPGLRVECAEHMVRQRHSEPTGSAVLTRGYHLPARYVLHTVGPIVPSHQPTTGDAEGLASCYLSCLGSAVAHGDITSVAFCAISTGVFGYPVQPAALVAIDAVTQWLDARPTTEMHVVFNTFSDRDTDVYRSALESRLP